MARNSARETVFSHHLSPLLYEKTLSETRQIFNLTSQLHAMAHWTRRTFSSRRVLSTTLASLKLSWNPQLTTWQEAVVLTQETNQMNYINESSHQATATSQENELSIGVYVAVLSENSLVTPFWKGQSNRFTWSEHFWVQANRCQMVSGVWIRIRSLRCDVHPVGSEKREKWGGYLFGNFCALLAGHTSRWGAYQRQPDRQQRCEYDKSYSLSVGVHETRV